MTSKHVTLTDLVEIVDDSPDEHLQAMQRLLDLGQPDRAPGDWRRLRQDFSKKPWKPALYTADDGPFKYHAYAVHTKSGSIEKEGEYKDESYAKSAAMSLAYMYNRNRIKPGQLK